MSLHLSPPKPVNAPRSLKIFVFLFSIFPHKFPLISFSLMWNTRLYRASRINFYWNRKHRFKKLPKDVVNNSKKKYPVLPGRRKSFALIILLWCGKYVHFLSMLIFIYLFMVDTVDISVAFVDCLSRFQSVRYCMN